MDPVGALKEKYLRPAPLLFHPQVFFTCICFTYSYTLVSIVLGIPFKHSRAWQDTESTFPVSSTSGLFWFKGSLDVLKKF